MPVMTHPEGATPLDQNELEGLRLPHISTQPQLNAVEQANVEDGLAWLARQKSPDVLSRQFLCKLHERLFGEVWNWAGTYRKTEKNIGVNPLQIEVQTQILLDNARSWLTQSIYKPSEAAMRFHHQLVFIHLFPNGNGRHSRIAADALLEKVLGLKAIDWSGGYDLSTCNNRRTQYIAALRAADQHDFGPLVAFVGPRDDLSTHK